MSKYVIRNCECILPSGTCFVKSPIQCQDCTDCVLKQIVEKCKDKIRIYEYYDKDYALGQVKCAKAILQLLDIEEVE